MDKLREWGFPVALIVAWMIAAAYTVSFLIGPVETAGRPFVDIKDVAFDPETRTFTLNFARGGSATLRLTATPDSTPRPHL